MVGDILQKLIQAYMVLILLRALSTWLQLDMRQKLVRLLCLITDPFLSLIRRIVPPVRDAIDISPAIAIVLLAILSALIGGMF